MHFYSDTWAKNIQFFKNSTNSKQNPVCPFLLKKICQKRAYGKQISGKTKQHNKQS